jgi:hypothetical protein
MGFTFILRANVQFAGQPPAGNVMKITKKPKVIPAGVTPVQKGKEPGNHHNTTRPRSSSSWTTPVAVIISIIFVIYGVIHYVMNSEPYKLSESFIRQNQAIKAELGDVDKCDPWYPIEMYPFGRDDSARLTFDVVGTNKAFTEVSVSLQKKGRSVAHRCRFLQRPPRVYQAACSGKSNRRRET